ncbi:hypothetical protein AA309_10605 [Microvirga vignae]|uniref:Uncharacterized protein n=1 Tax=Microvirga vignae TaxID=1225564 RepID=A0A0H1RD73_9HYPH|nr:hypothetical protein AA309_10605 [Microvirga vignae]
MFLKRIILGPPLPNRVHAERKIGAFEGVSAMGLDGLGSSSVGTIWPAARFRKPICRCCKPKTSHHSTECPGSVGLGSPLPFLNVRLPLAS